MNCNTDRISPIHLEWLTGHKLWPNKINTFSYNRSDYNYLECEFDSTTAEQIKHEIFESGPLYDYQPVKVYAGNTLIRTLYFEPGFFEFGSPDTDSLKEYVGTLELHDLHEQLAKGVITYQPVQIPSVGVYNRIFKKRKTPKQDYNLLKGIKYDSSVLSFHEENIFDSALNNIEENDGNDFLFQTGNYDITWEELAGGNPLKDFFQDSTETSITYKGTPLEAIQYMNKRNGTGSDITPDGHLYIGSYPMETPPTEYSASEESGRAEFHISQGGIRKPVNGYDTVIVEGPPPETTSVEKFNQKTDVHTAIENTRIEAVAQLQYETGGRVARYEAHNTDVDELKSVARNKLIQNIQNQRIESDIVVNGWTSTTAPTDIRLGDILVIPKIEEPCTNEQTPGGRFVITGVEHTYTNTWNVKLSIKEVQDLDIVTNLREIDIQADQSYDYETLYGYTPDG